MTTYRNNEALAHAWAHQLSADGNGSSFYFRGDTIYSYGSHFPIARHVSTKRGDCILFTTRSYSTTTARHIGLTRSAIPYRGSVLEVSNPSEKPTNETLRAANATTLEHVKKASRARTCRDDHLWSAARSQRNAEELKRLFGLRGKVYEVPADLGEVAAAVKKAAKREKARKAREAKKQRKEQADRIRAWKAGLSDRVPNLPGEVLLRIKDDQVETTHHASAPIAHALKVWPLLVKARKDGRCVDFGESGKRPSLGHFHADKIDSRGNLTAGCHFIKFEEMEAIHAQV